VRKSDKRPSTRLGTYGERVARERAARRRAAKERAAREPVVEKGSAADPIPTEPEIIEIPQSDLMNEVSVLAALISSGFARSHPEARRLFRDEGIRVNDVPVLSDKAKLTLADVTAEGTIKLSLGGERYVLLRPV
jgi:tyrosyl-tRNA synthetase